MQIFSASQLGAAELEPYTFTLPQGLQGAIVQNVSAWWLMLNRNGTNFMIPPWTIATYPITSAEGWTISGLTAEPGGLTVSQSYVEVDYSKGPVQLSIVPMSTLPIYQQTINGLVQVSGGQAGLGSSVYVATPPKLVGTLAIPAGETGGFVTVTPDATATGIAALVSIPAAQAPTLLVIAGANSGYIYAQASVVSGLQLSDLLQSVVLGDVEPITINVSVGVPPGTPLICGSVYETYGAQTSTPVNGQFQPLTIMGTAINPVPVPVTISGPISDTDSIEVSGILGPGIGKIPFGPVSTPKTLLAITMTASIYSQTASGPFALLMRIYPAANAAGDGAIATLSLGVAAALTDAGSDGVVSVNFGPGGFILPGNAAGAMYLYTNFVGGVPSAVGGAYSISAIFAP